MPAPRHVDYPIHQAATVTANGQSASIQPPLNPDRTEHRASFLLSAGGASGTSPTMTFQIQASLDGVNWFNVGNPVALSAAGTARMEWSAIEPFHQVVWTIGGTSPSFTNVNSHMVFLK